MKISLLLLLAIVLLPAAAVMAQAVTDNPAPAPPPDPMWSRVEQLVNGQEIVVKPVSGRTVHCRFAGATDAYLFCDPENANYGADGYRFDRPQVASVTVSHRKVNWHPALLATMAAVGIGVGIAASSQGASDKTASLGGLATALTVGAIGYPLTLVQQQNAGLGVAIPFQSLQFRGLRGHISSPRGFFR